MTLIDTDIRLEDITTDEDPPCEVLQHDKGYEPCGDPSVVRIRFRCTDCGNSEIQFYCAYDFGLLKENRLECELCASYNYTWSRS